METLRFLGWQPQWSIVTAAQAPYATDASLDMVICDGDIASWEQTLDGSNRLKDLFRALRKGG